MRRSMLLGLVLAVMLGGGVALAQEAATTATESPQAIGAEVRDGKFGITGVAAADLLAALRRADEKNRRIIAVIPFDEVTGNCGERAMVPEPGDLRCELASAPAGFWIVWEQLPRPKG